MTATQTTIEAPTRALPIAVLYVDPASVSAPLDGANPPFVPTWSPTIPPWPTS